MPITRKSIYITIILIAVIALLFPVMVKAAGSYYEDWSDLEEWIAYEGWG